MAIRHLLQNDVSFHVAGRMDDPRTVTEKKRKNIAHRLEEIHPRLGEELRGGDGD